MAASSNDGGDNDARTAFRVAVCATIVHNFPHEILWRKGMEVTGGTAIATTHGHWNQEADEDGNARERRSAPLMRLRDGRGDQRPARMATRV